MRQKERSKAMACPCPLCTSLLVLIFVKLLAWYKKRLARKKKEKRIMKNVARKALELAKKAHAGQTDKCGMPYWLHPYRVGLSVAKYGHEAMAVGFLHDILEDTPTTLEHLERLGFSNYVINAVNMLSRRDGESYRTYINRVKQNDMALRVKIADLTDNLRHDRVRNLWGPSKFARKTKGMYEQYLSYLLMLYVEEYLT